MRRTTGSLDFEVVPTRVEHGAVTFDVISLANGYPIVAERRERHARLVAEQLERFPEGQFVAVAREGREERVIAAATTMLTDRPPEARPLAWRDVIGDYGLPRHRPDGEWLYGVEIAVHPDYRRRGVATALYRARLALLGELGLTGWYAGGMLMGYHRYASVMDVRDYAEGVIAGELEDPTVSMQLRRGLRPNGIIEGYFPEPRAGDCAVLLTYFPELRREPGRERRRRPRRSPGASIGGTRTRSEGDRP